MEKCIACGNRLLRDNFIKCEGFCGSIYHIKCAQICKDSIKALHADRNLLWRCANCIVISGSLLSIIVQLKSDVAEIKSKLCNDIKSLNVSMSNSIPKSKNNTSTQTDFISDPITTNKINHTSNLPPNSPTDVTSFQLQKQPEIETESSHQSTYASNIVTASTSSQQQPALEPEIQRDEQLQTKNRKVQRTTKLFGTATHSSGDATLSSVPKLRYLHLSRLDKCVTENNIKSYAASVLNLPENMLQCKKLIKADADVSKMRFINFKLGIPAHALEDALDSSIWPIGVQIKKFVNFQKNEVLPPGKEAAQI